MKNKYFKIFFATLLLGLFFASCNKSDKNDGIDFLVNEGTKAEAFAGDWYVKFYDKATGKAVSNYGKISTFNTSENEKNTFWIMDDAIWGFQIKSKGNDDLTFGSIDPTSLLYGEDATITAGKILKGKGLSKTRNVTDSIYMEAVFVSDPDVTYIISGHKRTRWPEDDF